MQTTAIRALAFSSVLVGVCWSSALQARAFSRVGESLSAHELNSSVSHHRLSHQPWLLSQTLSLADEYDKAVDLYETGDLQGSIKSFSRILTVQTADRNLRNAAFLGRAKMYLAISQPILAMGDLKKINYQNPTRQQQGELDLLMGVTSIQLKLYKQAMSYFRAASSVLKRSALLYSNRGVAHQALGDLKSARRDFKLSLSLEKTLPAQYNLAVLEKKSRNYAECIRLLDGISANSKATPAVFQQRGICYSRLGKSENAIRDLLKALAADSANPITLEELAQVMAVNGDEESALKYLELASSIHLQLGDADNYSRLLELIESLRR